MLAPIVSTGRSAGVILKFWDRKYNRVPDLLVIEGPKAGGFHKIIQDRPSRHTHRAFHNHDIFLFRLQIRLFIAGEMENFTILI